MVGLGRMGGNMARRLTATGFTVHGVDPSINDEFSGLANFHLHASASDAVQAVSAPRIVWLMLPAGQATDQMLNTLSNLLQAGDILVDGGNANYQESQTRAEQWQARQIDFIDCGVSGGIWGREQGYCLMTGGSDKANQQIEPILKALAPAPDRGWMHCGPSGSGHFAKMIHNGIEYGMMQAIAEGFALIDGQPDLDIDMAKLAQTWRHGSVVRSWLLDLTAQALDDTDQLDQTAPVVADSGEGRWTIDEAIRQGTPVPAIAAAMMSRFDSQGKADTSHRLLALMRKGFGGHMTTKKN